jgi:hypothetical protein
LFHVLLWAALCCAPALILIPLRILDREPSNEIAHEQECPPGRDPAEFAQAA